MYKCLSNLTLVTSSALLVACGGGSDDNSGSSNSISFNGVTSQVQIDENNAQEIAVTSMSTGTAAAASTGAIGVTTAGGNSSLPSSALAGFFANMATERIDVSLSSTLVGVTVGPTTQNCSGGGTLTITLDANETTGDFTGSVQLSNCVEDNVTGNGTMDISGSIDPNTEEFDASLQFTFTNFNTKSGSDVDITMNGSVACDVTNLTTQLSCTENFDARNNISGEVFRAENLTIISTASTGGVSGTISGRFYHPDYGYVDITTDDAFSTAYGDLWPSSGTIRLLGTNNSSALIQFTSNTEYMLSVDSDGDSVYETITSETWPLPTNQ